MFTKHNSNHIEEKRFSLVDAPLKSARKVLGFNRQPDIRKNKYGPDVPETLRASEFPALNLEDDPVARLVTQL